MVFAWNILLTISAFLFAYTEALPPNYISQALEGRDTSNKFLELGFNVVRNNITNSSLQIRQKRSWPVSVDIPNQAYHYNIDLLFGSQQQKITVSVDTGSSDLWVVASDGTCENNNDCKSQGTYNASESTTSHETDQQFSLTYVDQTKTQGYYYLDDVTIPGGPTVQQFQFADANQTSTPFGILGIGMNSTEATVFGGDGGKEYADFPWALKNQGIIAKAAYSLYLNSASASSGTLLFGGIDSAKYEGDIAYLDGAWDSRLGVKADSITIDGSSINLGTGFVFDSGYSYSAWPKNVADAIGGALRGSHNVGGDYPWMASCNQPNLYITLVFGSKSINLPYASFLAPGSGNWYGCQTTLSYSSDGSDFNNLPTLGDDVLRSFYVVYDLETITIGIAQAVYTSDSSIQPIT